MRTVPAHGSHRLCRNSVLAPLTPFRLIEDFQDPEEVATFVKHIKAGLHLLNENADSLLVFSGGPTKQEKTEISEARSYLDLARANKYSDILGKPELETRVTTEETAVDSYQNLLFSLVRFYLTIQRWPNHITVVSHNFKKRRFVQLHCPAIRWPVERFAFIGIDPPEDVVSREYLDLGEYSRGYGSFEKDLYGAHTYLKDKREARGWTIEQLLKVYHSGIPTAVKWLLLWKGGDAWTEVFQRSLPWDALSPPEDVSQISGQPPSPFKTA